MTATVRGYTYAQVAKMIDHSLLRPELTLAEVGEGCRVAGAYDVASVCCRPADVPFVTGLLSGGSVAVGTVVGFPHGANTTAVKAFEARRAREDGATEFDMVLNIGWLRSGELARVQEDVAAVVEAAEGGIVKVILENAYLTDEQKVAACKTVEAAGAHYVKTSTGFAPSGATLPDLRLMATSVSPNVKVKAAHGVRTLDALLDVMDTGATRCGATATAAILDDFRERDRS
ncbi:deoxyribose-phosphate aldolase [Planotetraspora kaengkrachanensis]|uniref:Deoxyribose-phosphate aldolase n=1 Tax=Planotetraspora kaengkrachanensis TaxID=575193 RepID=A0A8J3M3M9_9ACTN|nr:deoxyribose-phosphate aldolase [Planotetraspora kaengkrachanensis]GIG78565.1 deoxyribose-phosphate aldolase [Planotetraspora kaengkrachanensis]